MNDGEKTIQNEGKQCGKGLRSRGEGTGDRRVFGMSEHMNYQVFWESEGKGLVQENSRHRTIGNSNVWGKGHWMNAFSTWGTSTFMFPQTMNVFMEMVKTPEIGIWMIWNLLIKIQDIGASGICMFWVGWTDVGPQTSVRRSWGDLFPSFIWNMNVSWKYEKHRNQNIILSCSMLEGVTNGLIGVG